MQGQTANKLPQPPMAVSVHTSLRRPRVAVTLGDQAGIGPEVIAKLLSNSDNLAKADIFVLADRTEIDVAIADAGNVKVLIAEKAGPEGVQILDDDSAPASLCRAEVNKENGERCIHQFRRALEMARSGKLDAIVFGPLNKSSMKKGGMLEEDELRWFAKELDFRGTTSEINIAGPLWTARVTSHVGVEKVAAMVTKDSTLKAIELLNRLRWESGIESPRIGVCALNPHNGENGSFGRQEIDHIAPAVKEAQSRGINAQGPFPCDTIFLKRSQFDGIVTMYHDQGQIAIKLLSFEGGVTVEGGLPVVITTPAHGTAFDIAGKNLASVVSTQNAFDIAVTMASRKISKQSTGEGVKTYATSLQLKIASQEKGQTRVAQVEVPTCC